MRTARVVESVPGSWSSWQPRWHVFSLVLFGAGAIAGALLVGLAPVRFMQGLGWVALLCSLAGGMVSSYTLQTLWPAKWNQLARRWRGNAGDTRARTMDAVPGSA